MAVSEQSIQEGLDAIHSGIRLDKYMADYLGPENKDELSLALKCRIVQYYSDEDILAYMTSTQANISKLPDGPGKNRHLAILDALETEKINREI
jgi:hypothetical protein